MPSDSAFFMLNGNFFKSVFNFFYRNFANINFVCKSFNETVEKNHDKLMNISNTLNEIRRKLDPLVLPAEGARVLGVLRNFHFFNNFAK
jgi:hypothetical protein